jgi:tetratricopeptide (TPR) repeat protein
MARPMLFATRAARQERALSLRWCALVTALLMRARSADAVVVLESHVGARPAQASTTLAPLLAELETMGIVARPQAVRARLRDPRRPGIIAPTLTLASLIERIDEATQLLHRRAYEAAAAKLESAIADAHANVALLVADPARSQPAMMNAWIGLATCRFRLQDLAGAEQAMQEAARSFPNQELSVRDGYGMEPAERYRAAAKQLQARGTGKLIITVNDPSALIFVNEWERPQNAIFEAEVLPGPHRVLVQLPGTTGWRHDVVVAPGEQTQLQIDVRFEAAVVISDAWVGLTFSSAEAARTNLLPYAARLQPDEDLGLIAVSLTTWNGQPAVVASLYRIDTGAHLRSYAIALDGRDDAARLRTLAHVLVDAGAAALFAGRARIIAVSDPFAPLPIARPAAPRAPSRAKWPLVGGTVLLVGAGIALVYFDNQDRCGTDCPTIYPTKPFGYGAFAAASLMAVGAGYLFYLDARARPSSEAPAAIGIAPTPSGLFVTAARSF